MCLLLVIFLKPNQKYEPLNVANFCPCGISFDELPEFKSDVMHIGLFITRKQKRKNWNVIHRTFPFLQKQLQLEQSIGMYILRLNIDGQLVNHSHSAALTESQTLSSVIYSKKLYFAFSKWQEWFMCGSLGLSASSYAASSGWRRTLET